MSTWSQLEALAPQLAEAGRRLLFHPGFGFAYLATVRPDGGPRLHPVNPVIAEGALYVFLVPSPKLADMRRDGRYAMHSSGAEDVNDEFYICGSAREVIDAERRNAAVAAYHGPVADDHLLFEFGIDRALWAHYSDPPAWPPEYHRWHAPSAS